MRWKRTSERSWRAECDGATLYVTKRAVEASHDR